MRGARYSLAIQYQVRPRVRELTDSSESTDAEESDQQDTLVLVIVLEAQQNRQANDGRNA